MKPETRTICGRDPSRLAEIGKKRLQAARRAALAEYHAAAAERARAHERVCAAMRDLAEVRAALAAMGEETVS